MTIERKHRRCLIGYAFVRFQTPKAFLISALPPVGRWGFAGSRKIREIRVQKKDSAKSNSSVEIREICGRQLSAQCAKEQVGCFFILPQIAQIDTDAMRGDGLPQIAPLARQIDTDLSQAERGFMMLSVKCGMWNAECGMWNAEWVLRMKND